MATESVFTITFKTIAQLTGIEQLQGGLGKVVSGIESVNRTAEQAKNALIGLATGATGLFLVDEAIKGVREAFGTFSEAVNEAAEQQALERPLRALIGDAEQADTILEKLRDFWQQTGTFSFGDLANATRTLILLGTGADNLLPRLQSMAAIAKTTGEQVDSVVAAYQRLRVAVEQGTEPMMRGIGGASASTIAMIRALMDELHKTEPEVLAMFKRREISIELINRAIADSTTGEGRFANALVGSSSTMQGAIARVHTAWKGVQDAFGSPIRDAITPTLNQMANAIQRARQWAAQLGEDIAHVIRALTLIAREDGWKTALQAAWQLVVLDMAKTATEVLVNAFSRIGPALASAVWAGYLSKLKTLNDTLRIGPGGDIEFNPKNLFAFSTGPLDAKAFGKKLIDSVSEGIIGGGDQAAANLQKIIDNALARTRSGGPIVDVKAAPKTTGLPSGDIDTGLVNTDKDAQAAKAATDALTIAKSRLTEAQENYRIAIEHTKLLEDSGEISSSEANRQRQEAMLDYIAQLRQIDLEMPKLIAQQEALGNIKGVKELKHQWQELHLEVLKTKDEFQGTTFFGQIRSQLRQLLNDWGSTGKQIGGFLTNTLNTAINSTSAALTGLIFRTGNWRQTFAQAAQSIVQNLIQIGLQMVAQSVLSRFLTQQNTQAQTQSGAQIAAAHAPAAAAVGISSYGSAATAAIAVVVAAIAAIIGAFGGFRSGGFTGEGGADEVAGVVHRGEVVFPAPRVREIGRDFLVNMAVGSISKPGYQQGGFVGDYSPGARTSPVEVHVFNFTDASALRKAVLQSDAAKKIIMDTVRGRRLDLGIA